MAITDCGPILDNVLVISEDRGSINEPWPAGLIMLHCVILILMAEMGSRVIGSSWPNDYTVSWGVELMRREGCGSDCLPPVLCDPVHLWVGINA